MLAARDGLRRRDGAEWIRVDEWIVVVAAFGLFRWFFYFMQSLRFLWMRGVCRLCADVGPIAVGCGVSLHVLQLADTAIVLSSFAV